VPAGVSFGIAHENEPPFAIPAAMISPFDSDVDGPLRNRKVMVPGEVEGTQVISVVSPALSGTDPSGLVIAFGFSD